jgi:hypothetical protein
MARINRWVQDASGSVADLGVLAPIAAALVIGNGFDAGTILVGVGALYLLAGLYFRVPVPVQPIKAAAAIAIARGLPPETLAVAGVLLGLVVLIVGATGMARWLARAFAEPIVRGLQLGVGLILMKTAFVLASPTGSAIPVAVALTIAVVLVWAGRRTSPVPIALGIIAGSALFALATAQNLPAVHLSLWTPHLNTAVLDPTVLSSALVLLVIPQIPLTFGNAVIAVVDLEHRYFPIESRKVNARSISLSCGMANVAAGALTGMPMCHGSGGLTAHYRAGARSYRMNLIMGGALLVLGLGFAPTAFAWLTLIPAVVLAGFLAFTGLFHSSLAATLRGTDLAIALAMGMLGLITTNLAFSLALGLALYWPLALVTSRRGLEPAQS